LSQRLDALRARVKELPQQSGVYLMKNSAEKILYVGKAKNLRSRVRSYFQDTENISPKTQLLVTQIHTVDYIITKTEVEAFLLEASLIKKHRPKYNIRLKDDRTYPYIKLSLKDAFPRLYLSRKVVKDGSQYFGPFTSSFLVNETIRLLSTVFQIRDCTDYFMKTRKRPCMTYQIGRCTAPCVEYITQEEYKENVKKVAAFLRGRDKKVLNTLEKEMLQAAEDERFETAARLRDGLKGLKSALEKQVVVNEKKDIDQDFVSFVGDERGSSIEVLAVRSGRVMGRRGHFIGHLNVNDAQEDMRDWLVSFLNQYYDENLIPDEVILPVDLGRDISKLLSDVLEERRNETVKVCHGLDRESQRLLEMAEKNAKDHFRVHVEKSDQKLKGLEQIQRKLSLPQVPQRIECYDISHFQGQETVASQVVFEEGVPAKEHYRLYKIKTVADGDDYESMKEVLSRRLKHQEYDDPDLILIDGGKGQLKVAHEVLKELGRDDIPVISIAKARTQGEFSDAEVTATEERIFVPGRLKPVVFPSNSEAFRILVSLRDEAHRFAISYHRKLRENSSLESALDEISGIGDVIKKRLYERFETVDAIRAANLEELIEVEGVHKALAQKILEYLNT